MKVTVKTKFCVISNGMQNFIFPVTNIERHDYKICNFFLGRKTFICLFCKGIEIALIISKVFRDLSKYLTISKYHI